MKPLNSGNSYMTDEKADLTLSAQDLCRNYGDHAAVHKVNIQL